MRTTITLSADLHEVLLSLSRNRRQTLSCVIEELVRRGLDQPEAARTAAHSALTGLPVVRLGRPVTAEDVRVLNDE